MKKILCVLLALAACCLLVTAVSAADTAPTTCQACGSTQTWAVLPATIPETAGHYHYYLSASVTPGQLLVKDGVTLCLDLNGYGIDVNGRAMIVYNGSTVNIMDSSAEGTGYMSGSDRRGNNVAGGTVTVQENGTLNLRSGTLKFTGTSENSAVTYGGTVYLKTNSADKTKVATMNMYGGCVEGGALSATSDSCKGGAAIYVNTDAVLNMYGGTVTSGQLGNAKTGKCILFADSTGKMTLSGDANVEEICTVSADNLTVTGKYTGKARLLLSGTPSAGLAVGTADDATISGDLFCTNGDGWLVNASGSQLKLAAYTPSGARHYCQHCQEVVVWTKLSSTLVNTLRYTAGQYHVYLDKDYNATAQTRVAEGSQVCLDLYGNKLLSTQRALYLYANSVTSVMDTVGGGIVQGTTANSNPTGGVMIVKSGAVFNLYSGTVQLEEKELAGYGVGVGGVIYMNEADATVNVYGGTIQGADLVMSEYKLTYNGLGAAFYMNSTAQLNVYGGQITSGTLAEGCVGECVYLKSSTAKVNLYGSGRVGDIYCTSENDQITVSGSYTGSVNLTYPATVTLEENQVVGKAADTTVTDGALTCGDEWLLSVSGSDLVLVPNAPAIVYAADGSATKYETLQKAIDNAGTGTVKLMQPITEDVTVTKDVYLDTNGKCITGTVTVSQGATLYGKDSQTDDYTVSDGIYGQLTVSGNSAAMDGYLKVEEEGITSFHKITLDITHMTLRAAEAGVYYKCSFLGDEKVAQRISQFGVALSVCETPDENNLETVCGYSLFTDFESGATGNATASTLLKGVMKTTNTQSVNQSNGQLPVYGRAYARLSDGTLLFGQPVQRSFQEQVEAADELWDTLDVAQKTTVLSLYETYGNVLKNWQIPSILAQKDPGSDGVLKILGIGNSYTQDSMWMLYNVYKKENPDKEVLLGIAYYGGCSLAKHVSFIEGDSAEYTYYQLSDEIYADTGTWKSTKTQTLKTIVEKHNWDIVTMQQASTYSGMPDTYNGDIQTIQNFVDDHTLGYTPTFAWNMTWAYPVKDIEGDAFTTVNTTSGFKTRYNSDQLTMYNAIVDTVKAKIVPDKTFQYLMPAGVAVQNANSSYLDDPDLYRDYTHLNDFARVMAAYVWYCTFEDVRVDSLKFTVVPAALTKSYKTAGGTGDMTLTQMQIDIIEESVKNALDARDAGTFTVTQSQYTTKP